MSEVSFTRPAANSNQMEVGSALGDVLSNTSQLSGDSCQLSGPLPIDAEALHLELFITTSAVI